MQAFDTMTIANISEKSKGTCLVELGVNPTSSTNSTRGRMANSFEAANGAAAAGEFRHTASRRTHKLNATMIKVLMLQH
jgi:hypothetical protein